MLTCTWAPTIFQGTQVIRPGATANPTPSGSALLGLMRGYTERVERLGISHMLIAQRWWGTGQEIEASSLDCLAMTAHFAAITERLHLITAIHPGFFQPTAIAKWGATMDRLTGGRWSINVTSGWNLQEFDMYGVDALDHDARYARSREFIHLLRQCWNEPRVDFNGAYYHARGLELQPRPEHPLEVFQGGQSPAALAMAAECSDWMFLNGAPPDRLAETISRIRQACDDTGRRVRLAVYAAPVCRRTDAEAQAVVDDMLAAVDPDLVQKRHARVSGAEGMWSTRDDPLGALDTNEGYTTRLIGSPETVLHAVHGLRDLGVDMLHLDLSDALFVDEVLPAIHQIA